MASSKDIRSMKIPEERSGRKKVNPIKFVSDSTITGPNKQYLSSRSTLSSKANTIVATKILLDDANSGFKNGNFVCSPFSLAMVLGMLASGAQGQTLKQLLEFLGHENLDQLLSESPMAILSNPGFNAGGGPGIALVNGIWVDKKVNRVQPCYKEILNSFFNTKSRVVDFENKTDDELARQINSWGNKKLTRGFIPTAVEGGDSEDDVVIALTNAMYFKGLWSNPFDKNYTKKKDFHLLNGVTVQVPFMTSFDKFSDYGSMQGYKIIKIPFEREYQSNINFSMYIFLPDRKDGLHELLQKFHSDPTLFDMRYPYYPSRTRFDEILIPKFKISNNFEPKNAMKQMGLTLPFEPKNMELNRILESTNRDSSDMSFYISKILQKSFIEVEEKGTEVVACSIPTMKLGSVKTPPPPPSRSESRFVADHPFMFMIREDFSRTVFYIGVVLNPNF